MSCSLKWPPYWILLKNSHKIIKWIFDLQNHLSRTANWICGKATNREWRAYLSKALTCWHQKRNVVHLTTRGQCNKQNYFLHYQFVFPLTKVILVSESCDTLGDFKDEIWHYYVNLYYFFIFFFIQIFINFGRDDLQTKMLSDGFFIFKSIHLLQSTGISRQIHQTGCDIIFQLHPIIGQLT